MSHNITNIWKQTNDNPNAVSDGVFLWFLKTWKWNSAGESSKSRLKMLTHCDACKKPVAKHLHYRTRESNLVAYMVISWRYKTCFWRKIYVSLRPALDVASLWQGLWLSTTARKRRGVIVCYKLQSTQRRRGLTLYEKRLIFFLMVCVYVCARTRYEAQNVCVRRTPDWVDTGSLAT